jgi:hypothetical protein
MKIRRTTLMSPTDVGPSGTKVIDINFTDYISRIDILFKYTVVTVSVQIGRVVDCITRVELVDGGNTIASITGAQLAALNCYNRKRLPFFSGSLTVGGICEQMVSIDFGRWIYDEMFAFAPGVFRNPQLRITFDEDASNTSAVINSLAVYAEVMSDIQKTPQNFICPREWKNYTFGTSSHESSSLPTSHIIKSIMLNPESADHSPVDLISTLKLSIDNDKFVIIDASMDDFLKSLHAKYPRFSYKMILDAVVTAKTVYANLSDDLKINIQYDDTAFVTAQSKFAVPTYTGNIIALGASVDIQADEAEISGTCPFNSIMIQHGDEWDYEQWLDARNAKTLDIDILSSSDADTGDDCSIVVELVQSNM